MSRLADMMKCSEEDAYQRGYEAGKRNAEQHQTDCTADWERGFLDTIHNQEIRIADLEQELTASKQVRQDDFNGLYEKYVVFELEDNREINNCFVLRPDKDPAAVEALRAYAAATENTQLAADLLLWVGAPQPLTPQELREMDGNPVYVVCKKYPGLNGWFIAVLDYQIDAIRVWRDDGCYLDARRSYGDAWIAYRAKVEELESGEE